jgi:anhydro-N-acetylmuramic acid kinase
MALNHIAGFKKMEYDRDGAMARKGTFKSDLFEKLNQLDYYALSPPKSLGREWFLETMLPAMEKSGLAPEDLMATVLEHIAFQVARGINEAHISTVLITGGGALNLTLIERIEYYTSANLSVPAEELIHYKEALVFALLGVLKIRGEINCLSSVTGGKSDLSAGTIH